ncbi:MAG: nodulation protein NfeD [Deltaproteobacteria bacterium]|jgi:membrane-bound serine protease (ClpP class)|nr:nodulation protein NfeD [Deltaproteobacteria bacterium]
MRFLLSFFLFFVFTCEPCNAGPGDVYILRAEGTINPGLAGSLSKKIRQACNENAGCIVIELDTPGGLGLSMRSIVKEIMASPVPVVLFVSPSGARAASAGVMIVLAADIAAMTHGTNIGAAHPVTVGDKKMDETMSEKVTNDMVAYVKSIATKRGRNADWAEKAVRESVSITEKEALDLNVIDIVADDLDDLLRRIDGRTIEGKGVLKTAGTTKIILKEDLRDTILKTLSDPNIAYILMMIGLAGIYFELSNPGAIFPGVIGAICLILAFFSFQTLPVNYAGFLLILLAIVLFILEMKITSYGLLSLGGILSLLLGSMMLFDIGGEAGLQLSLRVLIPTVVLVSGFFALVASLAFRAQISKIRTGTQGLVGETGVAQTRLSPGGKIFVHGELWNAIADKTIVKGAVVQVIGVEDLVARVKKADN